MLAKVRALELSGDLLFSPRFYPVEKFRRETDQVHHVFVAEFNSGATDPE